MEKLIDRKGKTIKEGDSIIHINFANCPIKVSNRGGVLYGGEVSLSTYHHSVLEVVSTTTKKEILNEV